MGPDDDIKGPALISLVNKVDEMIGKTCRKIDMSWDSFPYPDDDDPLLVDPGWDSLHTLLSQPWFDRGRVVQEAAAAQRAHIIWGNATFDWDKVMRTYVWLSARAANLYLDKAFDEIPINVHMNAYVEKNQDFAQIFFEESSLANMSLLKNLVYAKELDLFDPRDRIYAFRDLPRHPIPIYPDYSCSYLEVYRQFAELYIKDTKSPQLLDYVTHNDNSLTESSSWVPRWDIDTWSLGISSTSASILQSRDNLPIEPPVIENNTLKVQGVVIDSVLYVSELFDVATTTAVTIQKLWNRLQLLVVGSPYNPRSDCNKLNLDAFLDALSANIFDGTRSEWGQARESFARKAELGSVHKKEALDSDDDTSDEIAPDMENGVPGSGSNPVVGTRTGTINENNMPAESNLYFKTIKNKTNLRKFVITSRGYMGLAPSMTQERDACGIVFGCRKPCILRRAAAEKHFLLIGPTILLGEESCEFIDGYLSFCSVLGEENSKDWVNWDVEEQDIYLC